MSWRHGLAVGLLPLSRPPTKAVLLTLAHHANEYTGECWPALERIMLFTALSRRAVRDAINEAEKMGLITTVRGNGRTPTHYWLTIPGVNKIEQATGPRRAPHLNEGGTSCPSGEEEGITFPAEGQELPVSGAPDAPKQSMNNHKKEEETRASAAQPLPKNWMPSQTLIAEWRVMFPSIDVQAEIDQFIDNAHTKGEHYVDAFAALRKWLRTGERLTNERRSRGQRTHQTGATKLAADIDALRTSLDSAGDNSDTRATGLRSGNAASKY